LGLQEHAPAGTSSSPHLPKQEEVELGRPTISAGNGILPVWFVVATHP
jgi:hypothetical protein